VADCKWIGWLARLPGMGHEQDEFAEFYRASRDSCLKAVTTVVGDRQAMPPGTQLSIGNFPNYIRMALIEDGAPLSCSSTSRQPAVRITPSP
jgi:hypothetical protein